LLLVVRTWNASNCLLVFPARELRKFSANVWAAAPPWLIPPPPLRTLTNPAFFKNRNTWSLWRTVNYCFLLCRWLNSSLDNTILVAYVTCLGWRIWWYEHLIFLTISMWVGHVLLSHKSLNHSRWWCLCSEVARWPKLQGRHEF
jgi:hypothetical protein